MVSFRVFKCSLHYAKFGFYRSANAIFGKVGRVVSEDYLAINQKQVFANSVVLFRSLPVNRKRFNGL